MRGNKWTNVPGCLTVEVSRTDGEWCDSCGEELPVELVQFIEREFPGEVALDEEAMFQVEINFLSSGYYEPAQLCGPPERCYPEEGDDERLLDNVKVSPPNQHGYNEAAGKKMSASDGEKVFDFYLSQIEAVELERDNDY